MHCVDEAKTGGWIKPYYPAFDGLRALAMLMVFTLHYLMAANPNISYMELWTGVDLFFVLSGFLITGILYDSVATRHYFKNFYIRRALRIMPVYYGFFLLVLLLAPVLHLSHQKYVWAHVLYIQNLLVRGAILGKHGNPTVLLVPHMPGGFLMFGALWSLAIEEQFYLVWPLVVWLCPKRKMLMHLCVLLIFATLALRIFLYFHDPATAKLTRYLYYSTYARCDTLLVGAWIALWLRGKTPSRESLRCLSYGLWIFGAGTCLVLVFTFAHGNLSPDNAVMNTVGYSLVALAASGILLRCLDNQSLIHRVLLHPWLRRMGKISYGFYFFHDLPFAMLGACATRLRPYHLQYAIIPIGFVLIYALSSLSFHYYESPFLKLKSVLAPGHLGLPRPDAGS